MDAEYSEVWCTQLPASHNGRTPRHRATTKTIQRSPAIFVGTFLRVYKRFGLTSIRFEGLDCLLTVPEFIDKSAFIRSLSRFVRPLRHSDLVQEDEVIDLSWLGPCGRMWLWGLGRSHALAVARVMSRVHTHASDVGFHCPSWSSLSRIRVMKSLISARASLMVWWRAPAGIVLALLS